MEGGEKCTPLISNRSKRRCQKTKDDLRAFKVALDDFQVGLMSKSLSIEELAGARAKILEHYLKALAPVKL